MPIGVIFVCTANICRSPMAKGVFRTMVRRAGLERAFTIDSAGTSDIHAGQPATMLAVETARMRGYDISDHRARQLTNEDLEKFALPLAMDRSHLATMRWMAPRAVSERPQMLMKFAPQTNVVEVADPYGGPQRGYEAALDLIEAACRGMLESLRPLVEKAI
ncbi:MAG TPA: low molecular weight protein-tyrosine-phosphatase [Reyranella sp.]|jgi:protein-tyrosine phosphatase|nr:low molecular weight protein-tyrosine-phosphatase [Reyranella sp.]